MYRNCMFGVALAVAMAGLIQESPAENQPAENNVFPAGTFDKLGDEGKPVGWTWSEWSSSNIEVVEHGKKTAEDEAGHCLKMTSDDAGKFICAVGYLPIDPKWSRIEVSVRLKGKAVELGENPWDAPRLSMQFENEDGQMVGQHPSVPQIGAGDTEWVTRSVTLTVPYGARRLAMWPGLLKCTGTLWVDDIVIAVVTEHAQAMTTPASIPAAGGKDPQWGDEPRHDVSRTRSLFYLNGIWRFAPVEGEARTPAADDWGMIYVPGDWRNKHPRRPGLVAQGSGAVWRQYDGEAVNAAWYQRPLAVPADWAGRPVVVQFERVSTDAMVYVDGRQVGTIRWPRGEVDITDAITPGKPAVLQVLVLASADADQVAELMEQADRQVTMKKFQLDSRGLTGDVILASRPAGPRVSDVFVKPSTRKQQVAVQFELTGVKQAGQVNVQAVMQDMNGKTEKTFNTVLPVIASDVQTLEASWPWADARLWDLDKPELYNLKLRVTGAGVDDEYPQRFGFREFWIDGKQFYLNGVEIRLRPTISRGDDWPGDDRSVEGTRALLKGLREAGFNFIEFWPFNELERGTYHFREHVAAVADEQGLLAAGNALNMFPYMVNRANWSFIWDKRKDEYRRDVAADLRRYRNHPSIVMWTTTANFFGGFGDMDPRAMGVGGLTRPRIKQAGRWRYHPASDEAFAMIKQVDPTRPAFAHMAIDVGDMDAVNFYLNMLPLQEREEYISHWAEHGNRPYMAVEFGCPVIPTPLRGRMAFHEAIFTEPLATEYQAIYLGARAYRTESDEYRAEVRKMFRRDQQWGRWQLNAPMKASPPFQEMQTLFIRNTWRSWRTLGWTAGNVPWSMAEGFVWSDTSRQVAKRCEFKPGMPGPYRPILTQMAIAPLQAPGWTVLPAGHELKAVNSETLAWIAGENDRHEIARLTSKDHHFASGDTFRKTIALINDHRTEKPYSLTWSAHLGERRIAGTDEPIKGRIGPAKNVLLPISIDLPQITEPKINGQIRLSARIGEHSHEDVFTFRVYGEPAPTRLEVALFDPVGKTAAMLGELGITTTQWSGEPTEQLLVIGREVLSDGRKLPADLEAFVRNGGRAVVMAQHPDWLHDSRGLRVAAYVARRAFPVGVGDPLLPDIDAEDLRDWSGHGTLVEARPDYFSDMHRKGPGGLPYYGWKWGNRGSVSCAAIEKPHLTGWTPLLECEFDLAYTPLMMLNYGRGRLVWCTLDLEDAVSRDPAAAAVARTLFDHIAAAPRQPRAQTVHYVGNDDDWKWVQQLGIHCKRSTALDNEAELAIIGNGFDDDQSLQTFIEQGGKAFIIARPAGESILGLTARSSEGLRPSVDAPNFSESRGIGASDLHTRVDMDMTTFANGQRFVQHERGSGVAILCQMDPRQLQADRLTFNRLTRWRQTRAVCQLLANLGASFDGDRTIFHDAEPMSLSLSGQWKARHTVKLDAAKTAAKAHDDPGISDAAGQAVRPGFDDSKWSTVKLPGMLDTLIHSDGEVVLRRSVDIPGSWAGRQIVFSSGAIDDFDTFYFDGHVCGSTDASAEKPWSTPRKYVIPAELARPGRHVIAIRLFDRFGGGGMQADGDHITLTPEAPGRPVTRMYHPDYRNDFRLGDDPYRYYRW